MPKHFLTTTDALTGAQSTLALTQELISSLPNEVDFYALPSVEIHDGGAHPDGQGGIVANYRFTVPAFVRRDGSTYWITSGIGDIGEVTTMGLASSYDAHDGTFQIDTQASGTFRLVERDASGNEVQSVGPFTSQNP